MGRSAHRCRALIVAALLSFVVGCAGVAPTAQGLVDLVRDAEEPLGLVYLGNGGWIISHARDTVLTGPLFTNPGGFQAGLLHIRSDTAVVDRYLSRYDLAGTKAILVGHAHYDHLMDVPRTAAVHAPAARIVGSRTVANLLGTWSRVAHRVDLVEANAGDVDHHGQWMYYGLVRVLPLRSHHGPHYASHTLYQGTVDRTRAAEPTTAMEWPDGETHAFLVDFLRADSSVAYRVFYQDAVAEAPFGLAPRSVIAERSVDVAILVPSTFEEVSWHPEALIDNLRPRYVLLGHWEDFFGPVSEPMKPSPMTDHAEFDRRLLRVFEGDWWRPARWTEFRFGPG